MSSLPQIFQSAQSSYLKPTKQGGIFALRMQCSQSEAVQPEEYFSLKSQKNETRAGTSHTMRSKRVMSTQEEGARNINTSQSQRRAPGRRTSSRQSSGVLRKDMFSNYGNSRVAFAIGESTSAMTEEADSIFHSLNQGLAKMQELDSQFFQAVKLRSQTASSLKRFPDQHQSQLAQLSAAVLDQVCRLRSMLSSLRKQSGMETKVNKMQVQQLGSQISTLGQVMSDVSGSISTIGALCMK